GPAAAVVVALLPDHVGDAEVLLVVQDVVGQLVTGCRVDHEVQRQAAGVVAGVGAGGAAADVGDAELLLDVVADLGDGWLRAGQHGRAWLSRLLRWRGLLRCTHRRRRHGLRARDGRLAARRAAVVARRGALRLRYGRLRSRRGRAGRRGAGGRVCGDLGLFARRFRTVT